MDVIDKFLSFLEKRDVLVPVAGNAIDFTFHFGDGLLQEVAVVSAKIVKDYGYGFHQSKFEVVFVVGCVLILSHDVAVVFDTFKIVHFQE